MKLVAVAGLSALCACAGLSRDARQEPLERFDEHGVGTAVLKVEAGHVLQFVNADARPHQIYSNDCGELSSAVLTPGATYAVEIGTGPKAVPPSGSARAALHRLLGRESRCTAATRNFGDVHPKPHLILQRRAAS